MKHMHGVWLLHLPIWFILGTIATRQGRRLTRGARGAGENVAVVMVAGVPAIFAYMHDSLELMPTFLESFRASRAPVLFTPGAMSRCAWTMAGVVSAILLVVAAMAWIGRPKEPAQG